MGKITTENKMQLISELVTSTAAQVAFEEIREYEKEHENHIVDMDIKDLVKQRATSELMFRTCNFKCSIKEPDEEEFRGEFENWFLLDENDKLRNMCKMLVRDEVAKRIKPGEENLTFTDRYLRKIKEEGKNYSTLSLLNEMNKYE